MGKIKSIIAREIKDSRGNPTVEVEIETDKGLFVDKVPSGASTGENEALELRDKDGKGVRIAIANVNDIIAPKLVGKNPESQAEIDEIMIQLDGTENKYKLGANAILGVSMAVCRAGAASKKIPLYQHISELCEAKLSTKFRMPLGMFNILNGGKHVSETAGHLVIQEFMVVPQKENFSDNLAICNKIFNNLKELVENSFGSAELGDEGGFAPKILKTEQALYLLKSAIADADAKIALDCAASEFYKNGKYEIDGQKHTRGELIEFYENLVKNFPINSIEDPFSQEDWNGFEEMMKLFSENDNMIIVGDDLTTTNIKRIQEAHNKSACNAVIIKLNQIGTLTETIKASNLAKSFGWKTIISHRSGETMDDFIADLAVGASADFIKSGSPAKEERMAKYKRLLEIEQELNKK